MFQEPRDAAEHAELTQAEIAAAGKLVEQALHCRGFEYYSDEECGVLAILVAYHSYQQRAWGKKVEWLQKRKLSAVEALSISSCVLLWRKNIARSQDRWRRL